MQTQKSYVFFDEKNQEITIELIEITQEELLCDKYNERFLPLGSCLFLKNIDEKTQNFSDEFLTFKNKKGDYLDFVLVNKKDLRNFRDDILPVIGCCGADGSVMNIHSKATNKPIGFEYSDCYQYHFVALDLPNLHYEENIEINKNAFMLVFSYYETENSFEIIEISYIKNEIYWKSFENATKQKIKRLKLSKSYLIADGYEILERSKWENKKINFISHH